MKDHEWLIRYLTGQSTWKRDSRFQENGGLTTLYVRYDYVHNDYNYITTMEKGNELKVFKDNQLIYTSVKDLTNGDGI